MWRSDRRARFLKWKATGGPKGRPATGRTSLAARPFAGVLKRKKHQEARLRTSRLIRLSGCPYLQVAGQTALVRLPAP
jgi:hypothetical protein